MDRLRGQERSADEEQEWENESGGEKGNRLDVVSVCACVCGAGVDAGGVAGE